MSLEEEVLAEIKPTQRDTERVHKAATELAGVLADFAKDRGIPGTPLLMGSVAKGTFLKNPEIDVFVAFPDTTPREDLEQWGLELGSVLDKPTRRYAEHPYTHGSFKGYEADVVPCYKLEEPSARMTAVDRTPFHLTYVREHLEEGQKDQVRLLKRFMKGTGVYGAEARVEGFSGYLCELLVLRFGAFRAVLEGARGWRPPVHLQLETGPERDFEEPLVFTDPVDGERNAASAVSLDSLATFIHAAREYLREPHRVFFFPEEPPVRRPSDLKRELESRGTSVLAVTSSAPDLPDDVLFPQLRKAEQAMVSYLESQHFRLLRSQPFLLEREWCILLEMEVHRLPQVKKHVGPPPWLSNAYSFTTKWESSSDLVAGPFIEEGRLVVEINRQEVDAAEALERAIPTLSLGKNLDESVKGGFNIYGGAEIVQRYREILSSFLSRRLPWRFRKA